MLNAVLSVTHRAIADSLECSILNTNLGDWDGCYALSYIGMDILEVSLLLPRLDVGRAGIFSA